ncbi:MAG: CBS domain-containing protein [Gammaproteobacteria bacterium]|nr:CBS domain-containing protein [Gammaproteobacteria bacterium]
MLVKDKMSGAPVTIRGDADYKSAFGIMDDHAIHHLPVVDKNETLIGLVTLRDLQTAARCYLEAPAEITDVMHTELYTVKPDDALLDAVQLMDRHRIGCVPVIGEQARVVGMLTETDLFRTLSDFLQN